MKPKFKINIANDKHLKYIDIIRDTIELSAKRENATSIYYLARLEGYIESQIQAGNAIIVIAESESSKEEFAGFCYIKPWNKCLYSIISGLIVVEKFRRKGLGGMIMEKAFELSSKKYPDAQLLGLTSNETVMKICTKFGFKPISYANINIDESYWRHCQACINYDILVRNENQRCICTGMLYSPALETSKKKDIRVFISYKHEDAEFAEEIDQHLRIYNFDTKRDIRDIGDWKSIKKFMQSIKEQDYAVLIISEAYLQSINCMYEVYEVMKNNKYHERIFPCILDKSIYTIEGKVKYIKYWQNKTTEISLQLKKINAVNSAELATTLNQVQKIQNSVGEFLDVISDMKNPNNEQILDSIIKALP